MHTPKVFKINNWADRRDPKPVYNRVAFDMPDGQNLYHILTGVPDTWEVEARIEPDNYRTWFVARSPDGNECIVERCMRGHAKARTETDPSGKSTDEIIASVRAQLSGDDGEVEIPKRKFEIVPVDDGQVTFNRGSKTHHDSLTIRLDSATSFYMASHAAHGFKRHVFAATDKLEVFALLSIENRRWLLESIRRTPGFDQRREAWAEKGEVAGKTPAEIVEYLYPKLEWNPQSFTKDKNP